MMANRKLKLLSFAIMGVVTNVFAQPSSADFDKAMTDLLSAHYEQYHEAEYFSGMTLSVYLPEKSNGTIKNYYIGKVAHDPASAEISSQTLFQIGSITKSYTAAILLQLEKEGKLNLEDTISQWLPQYSKWSNIDIRSMLNMTSGLPNYSDSPLWNTAVSKDLEKSWNERQLIDFVYPKSTFNPPLRKGYYYTNTGYVLSGLIAEQAGKANLKTLIEERLLQKAGLTNTFYPLPVLTKDQLKRMSHGYGYNQYENPDLLGRDMQLNSMTWAGAAGGIIATSEDVVKWVRALFIDDVILDAQQKRKLSQLISTASGKPIDHVSAEYPRGFGLGVVEMYDPEMGRFWFYEGQTLGFRALYIYKPCSGLIITTIMNSSTNSDNDHAAQLLTKSYQRILELFPSYQCEKADVGAVKKTNQKAGGE